MADRFAFGVLKLGYRVIPPRLRPERTDVTAGLIAVGAALVTLILFTLLWGGIWFRTESVAAWTAPLFAGYALPFVVPAAFLVGFFGVKLYQPTDWLTGAASGLIATVLVYAVSLGLAVATLRLVATLGHFPPRAPIRDYVLVLGSFSLVMSSYLAFPVGVVLGALYGRNRSS